MKCISAPNSPLTFCVASYYCKMLALKSVSDMATIIAQVLESINIYSVIIIVVLDNTF